MVQVDGVGELRRDLCHDEAEEDAEQAGEETEIVHWPPPAGAWHRRPAEGRRAVEADDPARNRCGCFLPDLTRLATMPSADFRTRIWDNEFARASCSRALPSLVVQGDRRRPFDLMNVALPLIAIAALGAKPVQEESPITVTAHPWAPFISPMGEPFRAHSTSDDTLAAWFRKADRNNDGKLTVDEMVADAERFFATLDTNHDGQIDPDELNHYEWDVAPEIQVNSRTRRRPGEAVPLAAANGNDEDLRGKRHRRSDDGDSALGLNGALQGAARYGLLNIPE